ncbi:MAG: hypothetical protein DMG65_25605 [Candidatus Angelobacter sp. Gp1-AA117]|nr:MAG: hypothetical protein DMG65_25605 [Candidatus Angelobacter sp. Gp1-AA117]
MWFNRRELDWSVIGWFAIGAVSLGLAGGYLFAARHCGPSAGPRDDSGLICGCYLERPHSHVSVHCNVA